MTPSLDRVIVASLLNELDTATAIVELCSTIDQGYAVRSAIVARLGLQGTKVFSAPSQPEALRALAARAAEQSDLEQTEREAHALGGTWIAIEQILADMDDGVLGTLVLVGESEESLPDAQIARLAKLSSLVLDRFEFDSTTKRFAHRLMNMLAGVIANVEFLDSALEGLDSTRAKAAKLDSSDLLEAAANALESARKAVAFVRSLTDGNAGYEKRAR